MSFIRKDAISKVSRLSLASAHPATPAVLSRQFSGAEPFVIHEKRPRITYEDAFAQSIKNPEEFWGKAAYAVTWYKKWDKVLDASDPVFPKWFVGAKMNTCYNCLDRHVEDGAGDQTALIYDCAYTGQTNKFSYSRLTQRVSKLAGVLARKCGVRAGDRVVIYMPLVPQAITAMLACARLGAIHSVVFGGFAAKELATRVQHAKPKVIISCNCGIEPNRVIEYKPIVDEAIKISSHKPQFVIMFNRPPGAPVVPKNTAGSLVTELDYETEVVNARPHDPVPVDANDPLYLLYTSGTTGTPKAVVRPSGGHAVALSWTIPHIYGVHPGDVWWSASDIGWVVGHSYIVYAPLLTQCTTVLYEGKPVGTPNPKAFFRVLSQHKVNGAFYAPTALRAIRREIKGNDKTGIAKGFDLSALKSVFLAGEHCDVETLKWAKETFQKPVHDHWWQTESGFAISSPFEGLDGKAKRDTPPGSAGYPVPGYDVRVMTADGKDAAPDELGNIVVKTPLPPGFMKGLWENDKLYRDIYFKKFPGFYDTADSGMVSKDGDLFIMARTDDVINVAGHRISTSALEEALLEPQEVVEAAVVGLPDQLKGEIPFGFIVLRADATSDQYPTIIKRCIAHVRKTIGPVADLKKIIVVKKLPKTRSGKIARNTLAAKAAGKPYKIPITIEDADVYLEIADRLREVGITPGQPKQ